MKHIIYIFLIFILTNSVIFAGKVNFNPTSDTSANVSLEGYADVYFCYDFAEPSDANIPYFVSNNRHNEFNINLAYISLKYSSEKVRATFTPGFGTYMNSNYSAERITLRNIIEANVGIKVFPNENIWIDAGIIGSPFTNESAISFDQLPYTRSYAPEYVPYYMTGARLTLPVLNEITVYLYLLNGWQVIEDTNTPLAFAGQIEYKPNDKLTLNLNTYYGSEESKATPTNRLRTFLDLYAVYKTGIVDFTVSGYLGNQQRYETGNLNDNIWWQINGALRYSFDSKNSVTVRAEYFNDPNSVMITPVTGTEGFKSSSFSLGYNLAVTPSVLFRTESRYFISPDMIFKDGDINTDNHLMLTMGITTKF